MTRILHISDHHGKNLSVSTKEFDLLVDTGDFSGHNMKNFFWDEKDQRHIDKKEEALFQLDEFNKKRLPYYKKINATHKIVMNGNHDFLILPENPIILTPTASTITVGDLKVGILRGSNIIKFGGVVGGWNDEIDEYEFKQRILSISPDIDILISHQPAFGILDKIPSGESLGSVEIYRAIFGETHFGKEISKPYFQNLKAFLSGHIHEHAAIVKHIIENREVVFSNAACGFNKIEID